MQYRNRRVLQAGSASNMPVLLQFVFRSPLGRTDAMPTNHGSLSSS